MVEESLTESKKVIFPKGEIMNPFGAFNFGNFIKIYLPGSILFLGIILGFDALFSLYEKNVLSIIKEAPIVFTFIAIPSVLLLGIFLNMTFFIGAKDIFLDSYRKEHKKPLNYCKGFLRKIIKEYLSNGNSPINTEEDVTEVINPNFFMLAHIDIQKYNFLLESYWYYYEFQMNTFLALAFFYPFTLWWICSRVLPKFGFNLFAILALVLAASTIIITLLCYRCAKKNYLMHKKVYTSYLAGLCLNTNTDTK